MDVSIEVLQRGLGDVIRIERELGGGGMSSVFLARDISLDRPVVVKVLSAEASEGTSADRFRREVQLIAKLQHPHVVPILAASEAGGMLYYVMPFILGDTLRARLSREGPLPVRDTIRVMRDVVDALGFAHAHGVIHRDIKPENILLEAGHSLVADFGVAKALRDSARLTSTGISIGTPAYMAPEQAVGDSSVDQRADLYAVGIVGYEMLTGAPPFAGSAPQVVTAHLMTAPQSVTTRRSDVPPALANLIMRALEKDPDRRPQSAEEMLAVLGALTTPEASAAAGATGAATSRPTFVKRLRLPIAAAAAITALTFGARHGRCSPRRSSSGRASPRPLEGGTKPSVSPRSSSACMTRRLRLTSRRSTRPGSASRDWAEVEIERKLQRFVDAHVRSAVVGMLASKKGRPSGRHQRDCEAIRDVYRTRLPFMTILS